jgi:hypothetical protein
MADLSVIFREKNIREEWGNLGSKLTEDEISKLKSLLVDLACLNWTVSPGLVFKEELDKFSRANGNETQIGATGSPPKNK